MNAITGYKITVQNKKINQTPPFVQLPGISSGYSYLCPFKSRKIYNKIQHIVLKDFHTHTYTQHGLKEGIHNREGEYITVRTSLKNKIEVSLL